MRMLRTIALAFASIGLVAGAANSASLPDLGGRKVLAVTENAYTPLNFADPRLARGSAGNTMPSTKSASA